MNYSMNNSRITRESPMKKQTAHIAIATASVLALTIGILLAGCSKDASAPTTDTNTATATLTGVVTDADSAAGAPIAGATVSAAGSMTVTTNGRGEFSLTISAGTTVTVRVTKADYSLNEIVMNLAPGSVRTVSVGLLRVGAEQTLPVSTGGYCGRWRLHILDATRLCKCQGKCDGERHGSRSHDRRGACAARRP